MTKRKPSSVTSLYESDDEMEEIVDNNTTSSGSYIEKFVPNLPPLRLSLNKKFKVADSDSEVSDHNSVNDDDDNNHHEESGHNCSPDSMETDEYGVDVDDEEIYLPMLSPDDIPKVKQSDDDLQRVYDLLGSNCLPVNSAKYKVEKDEQLSAMYDLLTLVTVEGITKDEEAVKLSTLYLIVYQKFLWNIRAYPKRSYPLQRFFKQFNETGTFAVGMDDYISYKLYEPTDKKRIAWLSTDSGRSAESLSKQQQIQAYKGHRIWKHGKECIAYMNRNLSSQWIQPSSLPSGKNVTGMINVSCSTKPTCILTLSK
jgi:hypothetical protein